MCHQGFVILVIMTIAQTVFFCADVERGVSNRPLLASRKLRPLCPFLQSRQQNSLIPRPFLPTQGAKKFDPWAPPSNPGNRKVIPLCPYF